MPKSYDHVLSFVLDHPWAITDSMRVLIAGLLARRILGEEPDATELAAFVKRSNEPKPGRGGVAVIPIQGTIAPHMNAFGSMSGGTDFDSLTAHLHAAVDDERVRTVVFDIDSPGGNVAGATEFAREVLAARSKKTIVAQANHLLASAAYWPMACCTEIVASPSSLVGAIGVVTMHTDISEALAKNGIKRDVIAAGKFKGESFDGGPLSEETRAHIKALVDGAYGQFVGDIVKGRGVKASDVRNGYGEGRLVRAADALELGMIDRVATLADTLGRYLPTPAANPDPSSSPRATDQELPLSAATSQERAAATQRQKLDLLSL